MGPGKIAALFSGVLVLVLALGGSYLYINRHHEPSRQSTTATAPPTPTPPQARPTPPQATPTERPSPGPSKAPSPAPSPTPSQPQQTIPHLVFPAPAGQWIEQRNGVLSGPLQGQAYYQTTQADYDPAGHDWVAIMVSLAPSPAWKIHDNPKKGLRRAAAWYEAANFAGADVHPTTVAERPITVDGKKGRYLQVHLRYRIKGLNSTGETATLVAVPTARGAAMFLASIPDTNRDLQADVNAAVKGLRLVK